MNNKTSLALLGALLLASNAQASPHDPPKQMDHSQMKMDHATMKMPATPEARAKMANTMFDKIDTNKNGSLSRAEFVEHHRTMSMDHGDMRMDQHGKDAKKHVGKTHYGNKHEGTDHHAMDHAGQAPAAVVGTFATLDGNKDGKLSKAEMAKHPMAAHFAMLDTNKNGYLSSKEAAAHGL